jgi:hypothetical protein
LTATQTGFAGLLNQRAACAHGAASFWDVRLSGGAIMVEIDDGTHLTTLTSTGAKVDDGRQHEIVVKRTAGTLTITIDGVASGSASAAASLGAMPALVRKTDVCDGHSGQVPFTGTLASVCVASP